MSLTDTHCHLNHADFGDDWREAIVRARDAGVQRLLVIGCDLTSSRRAVEIATTYDNVYAVVGVHPESAADWSETTRDALIALRVEAGAKVVAWGEVGLDYYWEGAPHDLQRSIFDEQIDIACDLHLPLVIHCRSAFTDVLDVLESHGNPSAVLHCFTGTRAEADRAVAAGFYIGVGGIATFKKSDELRAIIANVPLERLLLETDSPYLAPQARRGKRNEPSYVPFIAETLSPLFNITASEFGTATTTNAIRLFGL